MTMPRHSALLAFCCAALLAACAPAPNTGPGTMAESCPAAFGGPLLMFHLFLGRSMPPFGEVTDGEWDKFANQIVTPALPNGYTVYDATGAWMSPASGKTIRERTKVLMAALPDTPGSIAAVKRISNDYRVKFHQQVVGMTVTPACGSF